MKDRINEKINEIDSYLGILMEIVPSSLDEYISNYKIKWSCERGFENVVEAIADLALLIIKEKQLEKAEDDLNAFEILERKNIISGELSRKLQDAKGMRNIIAHEYGKIDENIIFEALSIELEKDAKEFISKIKDFLKEKK